MKFNAQHEQHLKQLKGCFASAEFLITLAELKDTEVAQDLRDAGFVSAQARKLLDYSYSERECLDAKITATIIHEESGIQSEPEEWLEFSRKEHDLYSFHIWPKASSIAANLGNPEICLEHILLVLLHKHRTHAYKVMTKLGVNQDRLLNVLNERMRLKATTETTDN